MSKPTPFDQATLGPDITMEVCAKIIQASGDDFNSRTDITEVESKDRVVLTTLACE